MNHHDDIVIYEAHDFNGHDGRIIITCRGAIAVHPASPDLFWSQSQLRFLLSEPERSLHYLGNLGDEQVFTAEIAADMLDAVGSELTPLREMLGRIPDPLFRLLGRALQITDWALAHRFCGYCGGRTAQIPGERAMGCEDCGKIFYPRLSPCVMALVTRGDYCLLARHSAHRAHHFFTVLAGFVEPGESAEQALHREVKEEVGLRVSNPQYIGSQPWPFPGQLMLGFFADFESGDIIPDERELAEADWFHYDSLPPVPGVSTLSGQLIDHFVNQCRARHSGE